MRILLFHLHVNSLYAHIAEKNLNLKGLSIRLLTGKKVSMPMFIFGWIAQIAEVPICILDLLEENGDVPTADIVYPD